MGRVLEKTLFGKPARFEGGLHEVAPAVYAWLQPNGEWGESNAGLVAGDGEALLVDTLFDPRLTRRMLDTIARRVDSPIRTLVNTHSDGDHVWGNQHLEGREIVATRAAAEIIREEPPAALQRFKGLAPRLRLLGRLPLPVVGSLRLPLVPSLPLRELGAYVEGMLAPFDFSDVRVTAPTRAFEGELTLQVGERKVRLLQVGPAHTPGDLIVHVPDANVVFAADIVFMGVVPVMWAGPTRNWIAALDAIAALEPDVVVPGHGPLSGTADLEVLRDYLTWVDAEAEGRLTAGRSVAETARELLFSDEHSTAPWSEWDCPERILITVATIDRHRRGTTRRVGARERAQLFGQMAVLAAELERR